MEFKYKGEAVHQAEMSKQIASSLQEEDLTWEMVWEFVFGLTAPQGAGE